MKCKKYADFIFATKMPDLNGEKSSIYLDGDTMVTPGGRSVTRISDFDCGYEHYAALNKSNELIFGGSNMRGQIGNNTQNVRLFCCTGWATVYLTHDDELESIGFDFAVNKRMKEFCRNYKVRDMAAGSHHVIMATENRILITSNHPETTVEFTTTTDIRNGLIVKSKKLCRF